MVTGFLPRYPVATPFLFWSQSMTKLKHPCPKCGAMTNQPCMRTNGTPRKRAHIHRIPELKDRTYVYAMGHNTKGPIKIGISPRPRRRLRNVQTGSFAPLKILFAIPIPSRVIALEIEQFFHRGFGEKVLTGGWFDTSSYIAYDYISTYITKL